MRLFLTSSTITKNLVESFEDLIGKGIIGLKAAFIPDAAYGVKPQVDLSWVDKERQFLIDTYKWKMTDVVLKGQDKVDAKLLVKHDVVFVNGGFAGYLAKEMRRTGFDKVLPILYKKGIVYVGSSGGSMVMSGVQDAASWYIGEPEPEARDIRGLGYVNFQIYPHFKSSMIDEIKKKRNKELTYFLLKDGQAISVNDGIIKLHGREIFYFPSEA